LQVAEEVGGTPSQVALNWLRSQDVIPIVGARNARQMAENLVCLNFTLAEEYMKRLEDVSHIERGFPHDFYELEMIRSLVYAGTYDRIDAGHAHRK